MVKQGQRKEFLSRAHSSRMEPCSFTGTEKRHAHSQPYLPTSSPRAAEDIFQLEADPECWVRDHFTQLDAAPQHQGLTCIPVWDRKEAVGGT